MNIWILNHYAVTPNMPGGTRHYDFGKELVKKGYDVTIFASSFHYAKHIEMKLSKGQVCKVEDINGVKFVWIKTFPYYKNDWRRIINMLGYMINSYFIGRKITKLDRRIPRPSTIIGSSVHLFAVLSAYWLSKYHKAKFIMEVRDLWPQAIVDMKVMRLRNPIIKALQILERFLYGRATRIITLLPLAEKYLTLAGVKKEKIVWIPNGVVLSRFVTFDNMRSPDKPFKLVYLGAHGPVNALDVLIKAAKIVESKGYDNIRFFLIGEGSEKSRLIKLKDKLNLKNVEFRDPVPKAQISTVLNEADVFILNVEKTDVFKYGISFNKLFDYMMAGKPIIFSLNSPTNPVKEAQCGFSIPPKEPEALGEAVIKLYRTPLEERQAMGERGRQYVRQYHNIAVLAERLEKCLREVNNANTTIY